MNPLVSRPRAARTAAITLVATAALATGSLPSYAGPLGAGETSLSGSTTPDGIGETAVSRVAGSNRLLVAWEGARAVTTGTSQGVKREVFGQYVSSLDGSPIGSPVLLATRGSASDATQDVVDPALAALSNGTIALTFAADPIADTGAGDSLVDTTGFEIYAGIIDPAASLAAVAATQISDVAGASTLYDQRHPDVVADGGQVRVVWEGDSDVTGAEEGKSDIWTTRLPNDLSGTVTTQLVSTRHTTGGAFDNTRPRVAAGAGTAEVVWEGVDAVEAPALPIRRIWSAGLAGTPGTPTLVGSGSADSNREELTPDVTFLGGSFEAVWSGDASSVTAGDSRIWNRALSAAGAPTGAIAALTDGTTRDTLPSVTLDANRGQLVLAWVGRGPTAGPGHHELYTGRWDPAPATPTRIEQDRLSTVDANVSADNAEALRPNLDFTTQGNTTYAAWARQTLSGSTGVAGRLLAPRVDLSVAAAASPTNPSPARAGVNPAEAVTISVDYANKAASPNGAAGIQVSMQLTGFIPDPTTPVTFANVVGPTPTWLGAGIASVGSLSPGQGGTVRYHGTMAPGSEGSVRTAVAAITTTDLVDDPTPLDNSRTVGVTTDYPPTVLSIGRNATTPTNAASVSWTVTFDQSVVGAGLADFAISGTTGGASLTAVSCLAAACTVTAGTGSGDGTVGLGVPLSATITDGTGKPLATGNLPFAGPAYTIDKTAPSVVLSTVAGDPTNTDPIAFDLTFSEAVSGLTAGELAVTNGTVTALTGSATTYVARVTPTGDGLVTLGVPAGVAADAVGNGNLVSANLARTYDGTRPVLTLSGPTGPQSGPFQVGVSASESVTGLALDDLTVTGGAASALTGSGPWAVTVTPVTEGPVGIALRAAAVTDAAGNTNPTASTSVTYDATRPTVGVTSAAAEPTGTSPVPFTLTFSEPVTGLGVGELDVTGGTATLSGSGATRSVLLTPAGDGPVSVGVPAGVALDAAGNSNTAGAPLSRTYDTAGPAASLSTTATDPTNSALVPVTVTWDEAVTGFDAGDIVATNGTVNGFSGSGTTYTFDVTALADGTVTVAVPAGAVQDPAGNGSPAATPLSVRVDTEGPGADLSSTVTGLTNADDVAVTLDFTEPVTGFTLTDLTLTNATATGPTGSGDSYGFVVHPTGDGAFSVAVAADAARDLAGNGSLASAARSWTSDRTAPTAELTYPGPPVANGPVTMALRLSEAAVLDAATDLATTNASVVITGGPSAYTLQVTPVADGPFTVRLEAGAFTDAAGNANAASAERGATYDAAAPTVTSLTAPGTARTPYQVHVEFSEAVLGLDLDSLLVSSGTAGAVTGNGTSWAFTVTPAADGTIEVSLAGGAAYDAAGNPSPAAGPVITRYDTSRPTVVVGSPSPAATNVSPIPVSLTFSEAVTGVTVADLEVTNGTPMSFSGAGTSYTVDIVPSAEGDVTVSIPAAAGVDEVGNESLAGNLLTREFDSSRPTVAMTTTAANPTNLATFSVRVAFSKPVDGFDAGDLQPGGGVVSDFTPVDARTWTFTFTPSGDGAVTVTIPENAAASRAGNLAFGATLETVSDRTAPTLTLTAPAHPAVGAPLVLRLASDEPLVGLTASDLVLGGRAHPGNATLTPVDARHWTITVRGMTGPGSVSVTLPSGAATDAATNPTVRTTVRTTWTQDIEFAFLRQPVGRWQHSVTIPTRVVGPGPVVFSATSSNPRVLRASQITLSGTGSQRKITLAGTPGASGSTRVVVTARFAGAVRRIPLRFTVGTRGADRLGGTPGIDVMIGLKGDDVLTGLGGDDILCAGSGDDRVSGGPGRDLLVGAYGRDVLRGGAGADAFVVYPQDSRPDFDPAQDVLLHLPGSLRNLFAG